MADPEVRTYDDLAELLAAGVDRDVLVAIYAGGTFGKMKLVQLLAALKPTRKVTSGTSTAMTSDDYELVKMVAGVHTVTLPPITHDGQEVMVSDGVGDLDADSGGSIYIDVVGDGTDTVLGGASYRMKSAGQSNRFRSLDGNWRFAS